MKATELISLIKNGGLNEQLCALYGEENVSEQAQRYVNAIEEFINNYGDIDCNIFSVPGRSEISGNHTDHNHGEVLAGSINLDIIAIAAKTDVAILFMQPLYQKARRRHEDDMSTSLSELQASYY